MIIALGIGAYILVGLLILIKINRAAPFQKGDELDLWAIAVGWPFLYMLFGLASLWDLWDRKRMTWDFQRLLYYISIPLIKLCMWTRRR